MTATEMIPAVGVTVLVRFENCRVGCVVSDVKQAYGATRLLITPIDGIGSQWVDMGRVSLPWRDERKAVSA